MSIGDQISDVLVDAIVEALKEELQTNTDKADPAYCAHVQGGKLQDDPIAAGETWGHSLEVHIGDPTSLEDTWVDELASPEDPLVTMPRTGLPVYEIGGSGPVGVFWWRRGTIDVNSYFIIKSYKRDEARQIHNLLRYRVEKVLSQNHANAFMGLVNSENDERVQHYCEEHEQC